MYQKARFFLQRFSKPIIVIFYIALFSFLIYYIQKINFSALTSLQFIWYFIATATIFGLAMRYWQIISWLAILKDLGAEGLKKSHVQLAYVYAKSWLGRYIPGTAPWILGKIYFASKHGVSKNKLAVSSLIESILQITVILAFSSILLLLDDRFSVIDARIQIAIGIVLIACVVIILPPVFNKIVSTLYKIVRKKQFPQEHHMPTKTLFKGAALYAIGGLLNGLFLFFLAKSIYPALAYDDMLFVIGATNLAGALGIIAFFAPSGLGVRDGVQLLLLGLIMPPEFALTATVLSRLWDVVQDIAFFGITWTIKGFLKRT